ncbi:MAG: hypothetical protein WBM00_06710 [Solirubrobacterales bacterium]
MPSQEPESSVSTVRGKLALALTLGGAVLLVAGVALVFVPAAFVLAGAGMLAVGLFGIDL